MKELYFPGTFMIGSDILKKFPNTLPVMEKIMCLSVILFH